MMNIIFKIIPSLHSASMFRQVIGKQYFLVYNDFECEWLVANEMMRKHMCEVEWLVFLERSDV